MACRFRFAIWLLVSLAVSLLSAKKSLAAWTAIQMQGRGTLYVSTKDVKQDRVEVRLSDSLSMAIEVSGDSRLEVTPLDSNWSPEGWQVLRIGKPEVSKGESPAALRIRQTVVLDPLKPCETGLVLPPLRFRDRSTGGQWEAIQWRPIIVRVTTEVLQTDLQELRDVAPPEDLPSTHERAPWIRVAGFILGGLAIFAAAFLLKRHWRRPAVNLPPDQWALRELDRLDGPGLISSGQEEKLATLVSEICRRYLDRRYQLKVSSLTTAEFLANQQRDLPLSPEQQTLVRDLLERCDLAKFARKPMLQEEGQQLLDGARSLVKQTSQGETKTIR